MQVQCAFRSQERKGRKEPRLVCRPDRPLVPPQSSCALPGQAPITRASASEHSLLLAPMSSMQRGHSSW